MIRNPPTRRGDRIARRSLASVPGRLAPTPPGCLEEELNPSCATDEESATVVVSEEAPDNGDPLPADEGHLDGVDLGSLTGRRARLRGRRLTRPELEKITALTPPQAPGHPRLLETQRLARQRLCKPLVGVSRHTHSTPGSNASSDSGPPASSNSRAGPKREAGFPKSPSRPFWSSRSRSLIGAVSGSATRCSAARPCPRAPRPSRASCMRPVTSSASRPPGHIPTTRGGLERAQAQPALAD